MSAIVGGAIVGGATLVGGIGGAIISSNAARDAADKQTQASMYASDLQNQQYQQTRDDQMPWRQAGMSALYGPDGMFVPTGGGTTATPMSENDWVNNRVNDLFSKAVPASSVGMLGDQEIAALKGNLRQQAEQDWTSYGTKQAQTQADQSNLKNYQVDPSLTRKFTMADFQADPGYAFRMQQGQQALERSAAARGGLMNGGTMKALTDYGQGMASQEYQNAYNRFTNDQTNRFNRLASLSGLGQTANAAIGAAGQNMANQVGEYGMNAANAQGAAGIASANAYSGAIGGALNNGTSWAMLSKFGRSGTPSYGGGVYGSTQNLIDQTQAPIPAYQSTNFGPME